MANSLPQDTLWFLDTRVTIQVAGDSSADGMSILEHHAPCGSSPPLHIHYGEDEIFHLLSGELRLLVDGDELRLREGETLLAPKGKPHTFLVTSPAGARWLTVTCNGDFERMVRAAGRPVEGDGLPPNAPPSAEEAERLAALCRAHGIELIGPPLTLTSIPPEIAA